MRFAGERCYACGQPIEGEGLRHGEGHWFHSDCYRRAVAPVCAYCGEPMTAGWWVDPWGTLSCRRHLKEYPPCRYCGRQVPGNVRSADACCAVCQSTAVEAPERAQELFLCLVAWVKAQGLTFPSMALRVELCDQARLSYLAGPSLRGTILGLTLYTRPAWTGRLARGNVEGVAMLRGVPSVLFQGVAAHELGHAWLTVNGVDGLPSWAAEGFCELLSERYYRDLGGPEAEFHRRGIVDASDAVYGVGFHRMEVLVEAKGFGQLVEALRLNRQLPS